MKPPVLLTYNLTGEKAGKIFLAAMRFKIRVNPIKPEEYSQALAALCGMEPPDKAPYTGQGFTDEMLVMANFPAGMATQFLNSFRRMGIAPVALKAVLTPVNSRWDSVTLHAELSKERAAIAQGMNPVHNGSSDSDHESENK